MTNEDKVREANVTFHTKEEELKMRITYSELGLDQDSDDGVPSDGRESGEEEFEEEEEDEDQEESKYSQRKAKKSQKLVRSSQPKEEPKFMSTARPKPKVTAKKSEKISAAGFVPQ